MRTPLYESSVGALGALLASRAPYFRADLYTFSLLSGTTLRYTSVDRDVVVPGVGTFLRTGPVFKRSQTKQKRGVDVSEMMLEIAPRTGNLIGNVSWFMAARAGAFDYCDFSCDVAFFSAAAPTVLTGVINWFSGAVGDIPTLSRSNIEMRIKSDTSRFTIMMPRNLVEPGCKHTLFDAGCGLNKDDWDVTGTVAAINSDGTFRISNTNFAFDYLTRGRILFTSGNNQNVIKHIQRQEGFGGVAGTGIINLRLDAPTAYPLTVGTTFTVWPGCPKTSEVCEGTFNNRNNFRGIKFVPVPETVI